MYRVNDVPTKENYEDWKKAIRDKELEIAKLYEENQTAMKKWRKHRGDDNEKEYVDAYNQLQFAYLLAKDELEKLKKGI